MAGRLRQFVILGAVFATPLFAKPVPPATPAGNPVDCLPVVSLESRIRDDSTIDFFSGRKAYRVTLPHACPGLASAGTFSYETSLSQLCALDIITVLNRAGGGFMRGPSCGLAKFQPVTGLKR